MLHLSLQPFPESLARSKSRRECKEADLQLSVTEVAAVESYHGPTVAASSKGIVSSSFPFVRCDTKPGVCWKEPEICNVVAGSPVMEF